MAHERPIFLPTCILDGWKDRRSPVKALDGIRVIDMTHNQAGPACAQILAWLEADGVKLETPGKGDVARTQNNDELFFLSFNANKRSRNG